MAMPIPTSAPPNLFIFLEIFSREGGIQSYVKDLLQGYTQLPHLPPADIFLLRDDRTAVHPFAAAAEAPALRFHSFKAASAAVGRLHLATALLLHLLKNRPRRVFCGHVKLAPMVQLFCKSLGIPYTVLTYGKEVWAPLPPASRQALQQADRIWTISRYSRDNACEANQLDPQKFRMMPCAVDGDRFTPGSKSSTLLEKYGLADAKVLMTVARLWSGDIYKGVDVTIRALPAIAQVFPTVKYLVIGRGDDQPRLAQLAQDLGVAERVVFAGFVPTEALPDHYRLADAYVMPSQEGFGIVYLEAMACGKPVLSGDADGSADPLQDGKLGWRVPHRDPEAVVQACIEILQGIHAAETDAEPHQATHPLDRRCDGDWLREQAIALFGKAAFLHQLDHLLQEP